MVDGYRGFNTANHHTDCVANRLADTSTKDEVSKAKAKTPCKATAAQTQTLSKGQSTRGESKDPPCMRKLYRIIQ